MKKVLTFLFVASCASAQLTEHERICVLETIHGIPDPTCVAPPPAPVCGDGAINQPSEACDGSDLGGETCISQGFDGGTLTCFPAGHASECTFDTSTCTTNPPPPPPPGGVYNALAQQLPSPGEFAKIPGSDNIQGDVLVALGEFPYCDDLSCFSSWNSFLAWVGMAFDEVSGKWWNPAGGGHGDYGGNETYLYDFPTLDWVRLTQPDPYTGLRTVLLNDGTGNTCTLPDELPNASHSYDGALYVPSTNEVMLTMSVARCIGHGVGPTDAGLAVWDLDTDTWREIWPASWTQPSSQYTRYAFSAYDAARDKVYFSPGSRYWREMDPQANYASTTIGTIQNNLYTNNWGVAEFDEATRHLYWVDWGYGIFRASVSSTGVFGVRERLETASSFWVAENSPLAFAIHKPTGDLVFWGSRGRVFRVVPNADSWEVLTDTTEPLPATQRNTIYSKWIYISAVDAFVGVNEAREGVWVYRLPDAAPPPPPPPGGSANFDERRSAPGVVFADPLDTDGPYDGAGAVLLNDDGSTGIPTESWWLNWRGVQCTGCTLPRLDTTVKASGTGSLKFTLESNSGSGVGGNFATNFSPDFSQQFDEGETFYIQYRWRADCDFIYKDCDPASPTYRTERRAYSNGDTAAKLSIISTGDNPGQGDWSQGACTWLELVTYHASDHALQGYHSCGWYAGFDEVMEEWAQQAGAFNRQFQPGGDYDCRWYPDPAGPRRSWGYIGPNCAVLPADEWITVQWKVEIGAWQPDGNGPPASRVTLWVAREGEPQKIVFDHALHIRGPENVGERYGKVWLTPFMTGKDPAETHPEAHIWYDELIVSRNFIADPA